MRISDVRTPQQFTVLHHICSTIFPLILGVKVLHIYMHACYNYKNTLIERPLTVTDQLNSMSQFENT